MGQTFLFAAIVNPLIQQVRQFMHQHVAAPSSGVVALSGGPDSTALAHALARLQAEAVVGHLSFAHINHQLRGEESDADEAFAAAFTAELARSARVAFRSCRINVAAHAEKHGDNLENTGRQLRYDWLTEVARDSGAAWIATGHSADDQAETVLHRLLRGAGLHGLSGIHAVRLLAPGITLLRPMLRVSRAEVMSYLVEHQLAYREDSSNRTLDFTRNRIRHDLLPKLVREYNPAVATLLCRLAEQAHEAQSIIAEQVSRLLVEAELPRAGDLVILQTARLQQAHPHLVREMFRRIWDREGWPAGGMTFEHWKRLSDFISDSSGSMIELPGKTRVRQRGSVLQIGRS